VSYKVSSDRYLSIHVLFLFRFQVDKDLMSCRFPVMYKENICWCEL
jgi:hypothetical protein